MQEGIEMLEHLGLQSMKAHLINNWPRTDKLITVAVSADAKGLTDVCATQQATEAASC